MFSFFKKNIKYFAYMLFTLGFASVIAISNTINYTECKKSPNNSIDTTTSDTEVHHILDYSNLYNLESLKEKFNLVSSIQDYVNEKLGDSKEKYAIYYYDINSGISYTLNEDERYYAASTAKVQIAMMVADKINKSNLSINDTISYDDKFFADGAGSLQGSLNNGTAIPICDLIKLMITESDNIACNMLSSIIDNREAFYTNVIGHPLDVSDNKLSVSTQYNVLRYLYENKNENSYYNSIIDYMKNTTTHDRLDRYIPTELVAHKIGDYKNTVNDIGIIYTDNPYILCIFSNDDVIQRQYDNISDISKKIYELQTSSTISGIDNINKDLKIEIDRK